MHFKLRRPSSGDSLHSPIRLCKIEALRRQPGWNFSTTIAFKSAMATSGSVLARGRPTRSTPSPATRPTSCGISRRTRGSSIADPWQSGHRGSSMRAGAERKGVALPSNRTGQAHVLGAEGTASRGEPLVGINTPQLCDAQPVMPPPVRVQARFETAGCEFCSSERALPHIAPPQHPDLGRQARARQGR